MGLLDLCDCISDSKTGLPVDQISTLKTCRSFSSVDFLA